MVYGSAKVSQGVLVCLFRWPCVQPRDRGQEGGGRREEEEGVGREEVGGWICPAEPIDSTYWMDQLTAFGIFLPKPHQLKVSASPHPTVLAFALLTRKGQGSECGCDIKGYCLSFMQSRFMGG